MHEPTELDILARIISPDRGGLPTAAAQAILSLTFPEEDLDRMNELARRNRLAEATVSELAELENYSRVGYLISMLQSKARLSLQPHG